MSASQDYKLNYDQQMRERKKKKRCGFFFFSNVMKIESGWYFMLLLDSQGMISFIAKRIKKWYLSFFFYAISEMKWRRNKISESRGSLFSCQGRGVYEVRRSDLSPFSSIFSLISFFISKWNGSLIYRTVHCFNSIYYSFPFEYIL